MKHDRFSEGRLEALSDGVFAIAMTLLVLDMRLPELERPVSSEAFVAALRAEVPSFIAWLISFALLARLWIIHHQLLAEEHQYARSAVALNFVFLGVVSFIPFPTSVISGHFEQPLAMVLFGASYVAGALALATMWRVLRRDQPTPEIRAAKDAAARWVVVWIPVAAVVAAGLAFLDTRLSLVAWIGILLLGVIFRRRGTA